MNDLFSDSHPKTAAPTGSMIRRMRVEQEAVARTAECLKPGDAVVDESGFTGTIVDPSEVEEKLPTALHVFVRVASNHPLAHLKHPICYAVSRLRKISKP